MEVRAEMSNIFVDRALCAASPLLEHGYRLFDHRVYEQYFGSGWLLLARNDMRVRIVNDRGLWFVEIGSGGASEEWFDARLVLMEVGSSKAEAGTDYPSLKRLCEILAETAPKWEVLFLSTTFATARRSLRSREIALATERFDLTS
jgi:hypothetical protein